MNGSRRGTSLIDLMLSIAIIAVLFGGIYLVYFSLLTAIGNISVRTAAASAMQAEIEMIRNLPYTSVGTVGGVPAGVIPQTQAVVFGKYTFNLQTTIRNIDDPLDGTVSGSPSPVDTAPADYKLVAIQTTCPLCSDFVSVEVTTTIAPKNLESAPTNGSLFLYAINANGDPVPDATIHVVNASVTPSIDLVDTTNMSGVLQLVGVPTSTLRYHITATKAGYSTDQTYAPGAASNPNPVKPDATVVAQGLTSVTFAIDQLANLTINASDNRCVATSSVPFTLRGAKLIGTNPSTFKVSMNGTTNAQGSFTTSSLEWDAYTIGLGTSSRILAGTIPLNPLVVDPASSSTFKLIVQSGATPSLLVILRDWSTGASISNASVTITRNGASQTATTGHAFVSDTAWSGGQYSSKSAGLSANGQLTLFTNASGTYDINTNDWFISQTIDLGGSHETLYGINWNPTSQPAGASVSFQLAANNDNATWNFIGPDGTAATYLTSSTQTMPAALSGKRYLRYQVYLNTTDGTVAPTLDDVTFEFNADCVPPAQALFTGLVQNGTYAIDVSAPGYASATSSKTVGSDATSTDLYLIHS